jgi:hypothetical protein
MTTNKKEKEEIKTISVSIDGGSDDHDYNTKYLSKNKKKKVKKDKTKKDDK